MPAPHRRRWATAAMAFLAVAALAPPAGAASAGSTSRASTQGPDVTVGGECELWVAKAGQAPVYGACGGER